MSVHFARPEYLWLLLLLPAFWLASRRLTSVEPFRRWTIIILRTLVILLLILSLAKLEVARRSRDLTVYFLLDRSESIPAVLRDHSLEIVKELTGKKPKNDEVGLIVFGDDASLESLAVNTFEFDGSIHSVYNASRTDISSAMRLGLSAFPNARLKRMVLISDGNENKGSALEVARMARNSNVPVDVVELTYDQRLDVQIDKLIVPQQTAKDAPFDIKVFLSSQAATSGRLRLYEDGQLIIDQDVEISPGKNPPLVLPRRLGEGGFHRYRATIEAANDERPQNNEAQAFTQLKSEPRVLYVEGDQVNRNYLAAALKLEEITVDFVPPTEIPVNLEELQSYDSIILSNVHATEMNWKQMEMIERAVHDLGIGLIMIGGEDSFGAGGYQDSPIEKALPVSMDVKQKKVLPNGALACVLHTCEIPQGNSWAREISIAALNVLSAQDYYGLLYWGPKAGVGIGGGGGGVGEYWLWEPGLQQTGNKRAMRAKIRGVQPSDMPTFDPTLEMAYKELVKVNTQAKHIIIISDGDPQPPSKELASKINQAGITISTVIIAPHTGDSEESMKQLAYWGGGNFYYPKTANELPRIFIKEASIVRRSLIFEEPFMPVKDTPSEVLAGTTGLPQLQGYVVTSDKELATVALRTDKDDPLLAHWRYGLGKTVAFTSDAKNKWASNWVDWEGYSKFWSQTIRWSLRETSNSNFQVSTDLRGGKGHVVVDAVDVDGNFMNFLDFDTTVLGPDLEPQSVRVRQVGPGRYEGDFEADKVGTYMVRLSEGEEEQKRSVVSGAALSYSPEYQASKSNGDFLEKISRESGGQAVGVDYNAFRHNMPATSRPKPLWEALLFIGLMLIPIDVFMRRVYWDPADIAKWIRAHAASIWLTITFRRPKLSAQRAEAMGSLFEAKNRAVQEREAKKEEDEARKQFRERLSQSQPTGEGSVFDDAKAAAGKAPIRHATKQTVGTSEGSEKKPAGGGSLSSLKEAKQRAKKKM